MKILLLIIALAGIGAIEGFVAPIIAGTGRERMRVTIPLGVIMAVGAGLAVYGVSSLFADGDSDSAIPGVSGVVIAVAVAIMLVMFERRRADL